MDTGIIAQEVEKLGLPVLQEKETELNPFVMKG